MAADCLQFCNKEKRCAKEELFKYPDVRVREWQGYSNIEQKSFCESCLPVSFGIYQKAISLNPIEIRTSEHSLEGLSEAKARGFYFALRCCDFVRFPAFCMCRPARMQELCRAFCRLRTNFLLGL
jgi:hypothetical protein